MHHDAMASVCQWTLGCHAPQPAICRRHMRQPASHATQAVDITAQRRCLPGTGSDHGMKTAGRLPLALLFGMNHFESSRTVQHASSKWQTGRSPWGHLGQGTENLPTRNLSPRQIARTP